MSEQLKWRNLTQTSSLHRQMTQQFDHAGFVAISQSEASTHTVSQKHTSF